MQQLLNSLIYRNIRFLAPLGMTIHLVDPGGGTERRADEECNKSLHFN
jgi:hypothetical protein